VRSLCVGGVAHTRFRDVQRSANLNAPQVYGVHIKVCPAQMLSYIKV